ncbi:hypothetical protein AMECASPLE_025105 [Ameca splendens]|uniref:Immunoglobulin domain-containing protein n=1 Tax=Ameca splendens TaxID=208324 RepID=A0ABV1A036_9TELE
MDPAGVVIFGQTVSITCSVSEGQEGGLFIFKKSPGPINNVVNSSNGSTVFQIPQVSLVDKGFYQCQFQRRVFNQDLSTNLSDSLQLIGVLPKPNLTLQPASEVMWGQNVILTCSVIKGVGGSFILTRMPGPFSQTPNITIKPSGVVLWGEAVNLPCWFIGGIGGESFIFTKTPSPFSKTVNSSSNSATLHIHQVRFEDEGWYCWNN